MPAPLILAQSFKAAHQYATEELGLSVGHYRVVTTAGTIKAVRGVDIHLVPGWEKRPDRFTMRSALKWSRLNIVDVEKLRESRAAFDAAMPPAEDKRYPLDERTQTVAARYNALRDLAAYEAALPKVEITVVPDDTEVPQHHVDMVAKVLPTTSNGDNMVAEGGPADEDEDIVIEPSPSAAVAAEPEPTPEPVEQKPAKRRRRSRCSDCGNLHFKEEPCPPSEDA